MLENLRRRLPLTIAGMADVGMADVAASDWLAFDLVAVEQRTAGPAGKMRAELPAEIEGVTKTSIEAKPGRGMIKVGSVAREENPAHAVGVGHHIAGNPAPDRNEFVRDLLADSFREQALAVYLIRRVVEFLAADAEPIELAPIQHHEIAP